MQYANSLCNILQSCLSAGTLTPQDPPAWDLPDVERSYSFGCKHAEGIFFFFLFTRPEEVVLDRTHI